MKFHLDFAKHQSLGNVHHEKPVDNFQQFESAKKIYADNKVSIDVSIADTLKQGLGEIVNGTTITIPTGHYKNSSFINNLVFNVDRINIDSASLSLISVENKTSH